MNDKFVQDIFTAIDKVDELKKIYEDSRELQSLCDKKISDILHFIENGVLENDHLSSLLAEIKKVQKERRLAKTNIEIYRIFEKFNFTSIDKDNKNLKEMLLSYVSHEYQNRYYSEGLKEILG